MRRQTTLTQARLKELYVYRPRTGTLHRRELNGPRLQPSGTEHGAGYLKTSADGKEYLIHRLVWLYVYGEFPDRMLDHLDKNRQNNRIENLRLATKSQNAANAKLQANNKTGYRGVTFVRNRCRYNAEIRYNSKKIHLGQFKSAEHAAMAYNIAAKHLFKEFAYQNPLHRNQEIEAWQALH